MSTRHPLCLTAPHGFPTLGFRAYRLRIDSLARHGHRSGIMNKQVEIEHVAALADVHCDPIILAEADGTIHYANAATTALASAIDPGKQVIDNRLLLRALSQVAQSGTPTSLVLDVGEAAFDCKLRPQPEGGGVVIFAHDITRLQTASGTSKSSPEVLAQQREAIDSSRLLDEALEAMSDGIVIYDSNDRQVGCNAAYRQTYGYGDDFVSEGKTLWDVLEIDIAKGTVSRDIAEEYVRQRSRQKELGAGEFEAQLADGRWYQIRDRRMASGGTITIHTDVTHRKELEERIRAGKQAADAEVVRQRDEIAEREKRYRAIVEDQTEMISRLDPDLKLTFANTAYRRTFFNDPDDESIIGKNILDVIVDDTVRSEFESNVKRLTPENPLLRSVLFERVAGGSLQWLAWIDRALFDEDGNVVGYQSVGRDITAQKKAEIALAANFQERQAIVSGALDAIITFDARYGIREFNPAAETIFGRNGHSRSNLGAGEKIVPLPPQVGDGQSTKNNGFIEYLAHLSNGQFLGQRLEVNLRRLDGTDFPAEVAVIKVELTDGETAPDSNPLTYVAYIRDLSESQALEAEMEEQRAALAQSEKLGAMGSLLANVAHELNNPLAVVIGQSEILDTQAADDGTRKRAERINGAAKRCAGIVRTFLAAVRQKAPERQLFDPIVPVNESLDLVDYAYRTNGIDLQLDIQPDLPPLYGDANQIGQVLTNLLVNAQQALATKPQPRQVGLSVSTIDGGSSLLYRLSDNGPGVPIERRASIFEPFFTTKAEGVGTGIGLAIARNITAGHGGSISVDTSDDLGGACFDVVMPVPEAGDAEIAPAAIKRGASHSGKRGRILVVDDERDVAETAADHFIIANFDCDLATSGEQALNLLAHNTYDAIISDLRMPGIDGPALYRQANAKWPGIKDRFGFFTGDNLSSDARNFLGDQNILAIDKPFSAEDLIAFCEDLMARSKD